MASSASTCSDMDEPESPTTTVSYDLQDLVEQYKSQPELLKLILTSKVEEDKRRAEEARLRAKELDFYLHQRRCSSSSQSSCEYFQPYPTSSMRRRHAAEDRRRRNSAAAAMIAMGNQTITSTPSSSSHNPQSPSSISSSYPSPPVVDQDEDRPRKRREMQAITKIVETREFPYQDEYFWKNNGNTTQKKTGCKSIYYKCSNSNKGCPVNKTVTARPNGEYLIKYRGVHLPECGHVERIRDL